MTCDLRFVPAAFQPLWVSDMTHSSVLFVARANFHRVSSFELKMSEEINRSVESDRSDLFDYCDSTSSVEYILAFAHALDETYAEKKNRVH